MTKLAREFNERYQLNLSEKAFVKVDRPSLANDLVGKPKGNIKQAIRRFVFKPSSLIATLAIITILLLAILLPLTSPYDAVDRVYKESNSTVGELANFGNLPPSGTWVVKTSGTDDLIATFRARGFVEGVDWKYVGESSSSFSPIITYDAWKYAKLLDPSLVSESVIGTNAIGQDIWTRAWAGAGRSFALGLAVSFSTLVVGTIIGSIAGLYYGSWFDIALMRFVDAFSNIPALVVIVVVTVLFPQSFAGLMVLFIILLWPNPLLVARFNILRFSNTDYIKVAKTNGVSLIGRIFKHALPNFIGIMALVLFTTISTVIVSQAYISVIGIPFDPVSPYLGNVIQEMSNEAIGGVTQNLAYLLFPSALLIAISLALRYIGVGINDAIDPKFSRR